MTFHSTQQKLQILAYIEKKDIPVYKKDTREDLQSSLKQYSIIPFSKVPGQQSALVRNLNSWSE